MKSSPRSDIDAYKARRAGFWVKSTPTGRYRAYDVADTIDAAKKAYSRCRTSKSFLLTAGSPDFAKTTCTVCGNKLIDASPNDDKANSDSAHFTYYPKLKKVFATHYYCGWTSLLTKIISDPALRALGR
jgi:hypothetical protein